MQLLVIVLNKTEVIEHLMSEFNQNGIKGATILKSKGMARAMGSDDALLVSLKALLSPNHEENYTIFTVLKDEKVEAAKQVIHKVVGDLTKPDSGILFTIPISSTEGIKLD